MEQDKLNLVNSKELEEKSYEEILKMEEELMHNPDATHADLGVITAERIEREVKMGTFKGRSIDEVCKDILDGTIFEKENRNQLSIRVRASTSL